MISHVNSSCRSLAIYSFKAVSVTLHGEIKVKKTSLILRPTQLSVAISTEKREGLFVSVLQATESWVGLGNEVKIEQYLEVGS